MLTKFHAILSKNNFFKSKIQFKKTGEGMKIKKNSHIFEIHVPKNIKYHEQI